MEKTVEQRTGHRLRWKEDARDNRNLNRRMAALLAGPLSVDGAVQVALLNSPELQAIYEDLSLGQADVVQAGLPRNPVFSADITTAEREALDPNLIVGVTQTFLDLLLIPARKKVAAAEFDAAKFRVGNAVLNVAAQVKIAFYAVQAAEQELTVRQTMAQAEEASFELAEQQAGAGNVSELAVANEKTQYLQARLDIVHHEEGVDATRERLTRLMGLPERSWRAAQRLPDLPVSNPSIGPLEEQALRDRLDLAAIRQEIQTLSYALDLAQSGRWTSIIDHQRRCRAIEGRPYRATDGSQLAWVERAAGGNEIRLASFSDLKSVRVRPAAAKSSEHCEEHESGLGAKCAGPRPSPTAPTRNRATSICSASMVTAV